MLFHPYSSQLSPKLSSIIAIVEIVQGVASSMPELTDYLLKFALAELKDVDKAEEDDIIQHNYYKDN